MRPIGWTALLALVAGLWTASPAAADDGRFGIYLGPDSFGLYLEGRDRPWEHDHRRYRHYRYDDYYRRDYRGRDYAYGHWYAEPRYFDYDRRGHYYRARGCHPVTKRGWYHGRRAVIEGRMCYDRHGNPYIVDRSRHFRHYY
ncbi:MAG: hypothetical protein GC199_05835 [Alphaproteobacteria bacterium]|nr:hypothetical protein [Alphaproteobacteria bacterium]